MHTWNSLQLINFSCSLSLTILASFILERLCYYCRKEQFHRNPKRTAQFPSGIKQGSTANKPSKNLPIKAFCLRCPFSPKTKTKKPKTLWLCRDENTPLKKQRSLVYINM